MQMFLILFSSFLVSLVAILAVQLLAQKKGLYDRLDDRKIHTGNIPRLGGIGIFIGFIVGLVVFALINNVHTSLGLKILFLGISSALIFTMGVWDDLAPWRARFKLLVQCVAAIIVIASGYHFPSKPFESLGFGWNLGVVVIPLTFFWIIGVTNAVNFIDGIDGLAGSISALAALTYAFFFFRCENIPAMVACLLLVVSISGFLVFNLPLPKAKIFMGDGGSQLLGFALAVLPLFPDATGNAIIALPYAAAVLIIPIFDTLAAIWRRVRERRSIDSPDKFHLHHKLLMMGFTVPHALLILVAFQSLIGILVITSASIRGKFAFVVLLAVYLMGILLFTIVHIRKEEILEKSKLIS
jgi:UDP-GlcNAc:undecaprenyl-phosphate GlcNAc-1-phosphate transferase